MTRPRRTSSTPRRQGATPLSVGGLLLTLLAALLLWWNGALSPSPGGEVTSPATLENSPSAAAQTKTATPVLVIAEPPPAAGQSGLPVIPYDQLPAEAHETIRLIDTGGPFPFDRDGVTFQNREGFLPQQRRGYYREYTVITPGEDDRGARRIVAGAGGELYYTADHYASFQEVLR
jgi:ribonuclease T1